MHRNIMRRMGRHIIFVGIFLAGCSAAYAQDADPSASAAKNPVQRLCQLEDLENHVFQRVEFKQVPPRGETNIAKMFSHDYLAFQPG